MFKQVWLSAFALSYALFATGARAENIRFICKTENSANAIGAAIAEGDARAGEIIEPFMELGECEYLKEKMFAFVVHRGATYGTASKITVVGLSQKMGEFPEMWALMPADELYGDGTI